MVRMIRSIKTFSVLDDDIMNKVCDRMKTETFVDGEYICRKGEVCFNSYDSTNRNSVTVKTNFDYNLNFSKL